jgi:hypothetical protein
VRDFGLIISHDYMCSYEVAHTRVYMGYVSLKIDRMYRTWQNRIYGAICQQHSSTFDDLQSVSADLQAEYPFDQEGVWEAQE